MNTVPSVELEIITSALCSLIILWLRERPIPVPLPFCFVVKNGVHIFGIMSSGMPIPVSLTLILILEKPNIIGIIKSYGATNWSVLLWIVVPLISATALSIP